jgi:AAA family ATP:ADP antiporter
MLIKFFKFNFGEFEERELRKFIRLGFMMFMLVGVHWTTHPLRDSTFIQLVGGAYIPYAKMLSALSTFMLVGLYTHLVGRYPKGKLYAAIPLGYGFVTLVFSVLIHICQTGACTNSTLVTIISYAWFVFLESWGVLSITGFWGIVSDTTDQQSASRGIPFICLIGQTGGALLPYPIVSLPRMLDMKTDIVSMIITGILMMAITPIIRRFFRNTPSELMTGFRGKAGGSPPKEIKSKSSGFMEGVRLLWSCKYLICIFAFGFITEFLLTIFDFSFKLRAGEVFSGVELSNYFGIYSSSTNAVVAILLFLGVANIQRFMGVKVALAIVPVLWGIVICSFLMSDSLTLLCMSMIGGKAIKFALSAPTLKQLYIPTSETAKFKAQALIDTFESKLSRWGGSLFNMLLRQFQVAFGEGVGLRYYLLLVVIVGLPLIVALGIIAVYLGKTYKKAIDENTTVC